MQSGVADVNVSWAEKTSDEIREIAESPKSLAIIPLGSIEQHGPHLPTSTDTILANGVAQLGADVSTLENLLITPPVWAGISPQHMGFGGTITVSAECMQRLLCEITDAVLDNGFDGVLYMNGHGGNAPIVSNTVYTVGPRYPDTEVLGLTYWNLAKSFIDEIRESDTGGFLHGGELETSLMLHLRPDLVDKGSFTKNYYDDRDYDAAKVDLMEAAPLSVYRPVQANSESGVGGDPRLATSKKGRRIYERLGVEMAKLFHEIEHNL